MEPIITESSPPHFIVNIGAVESESTTVASGGEKVNDSEAERSGESHEEVCSAGGGEKVSSLEASIETSGESSAGGGGGEKVNDTTLEIEEVSTSLSESEGNRSERVIEEEWSEATVMRFRPISSTKRKSRLMDPVDVYVDVEDETKSSKLCKWRKTKVSVGWIFKIFMMGSLVATTIMIDWLRSKIILDLDLWKWEVLFMVIVFGRMVSGWMMWLVILLSRHHFIFYYLNGVKTSLQKFMWTVLILVVWLSMALDERLRHRQNILGYVTRILICPVAGSAIWLGKSIVVKFLSSCFHLNFYLERIQGSLFNQYVVEALSGTPSIEVDQRHGTTLDQLHNLKKDNVSASTMKMFINIIRRGTITTTEESKTYITTEEEANSVANKIFQNVARPRSRYILLEDLLRFMREDEAVKLMSLLEGAKGNKRISESVLKNWLVNAFRERRVLALTLDDTKNIVKKIHLSLSVIAGSIILVVSLLILRIALFHLFLIIFSQLVIMIFIFGNTCKIAFEAMVFLVAIHPFDVGDRCEIEEVELVVEEINALSTVFLRHDNLKITYPNSVRYIETKENHWSPGAVVVLRDVEDLNWLKLSVRFTHRANFQDMDARFARRECLVEEIVKIFKELEIKYKMLPLDVSPQSISAATSRLPSNWRTCGH